jgi:hypothetical protein
MNPAQQFEAWRAELTAELHGTSAELATARGGLDAAEASHAQAHTEWRDLNDFAGGALRSASDGMAAPLRSRVLNLREALDVAERARGAARAAVQSLEQRMADLQLAVDQIDRAITSSKVTLFPRTPEPPSRRKPSVIEYDNIVAREAI